MSTGLGRSSSFGPDMGRKILKQVRQIRSMSFRRSVHNKVISGFQALRQARAPVARLEPTTKRSSGDLRAD
ncbi:hypothetical protein PoB_000449900 [Plakobranchus ocellatus]|uniref:Uncharacterized protein n=1 Tax=Plakobranchus ocellatus TaxID=259542 RepID=A0AAV3Y7D6_9GAST|nr:hypothetical protein PoB_000449900 [Plakobranchus ocellatus]